MNRLPVNGHDRCPAPCADPRCPARPRRGAR